MVFRTSTKGALEVIKKEKLANRTEKLKCLGQGFLKRNEESEC